MGDLPVSDFGDYEPEDAWDEGDDLQAKLVNLGRRLDLVEQARTEPRQLKRLAETRADFERVTTTQRTALPVLARDILRRLEALGG